MLAAIIDRGGLGRTQLRQRARQERAGGLVLFQPLAAPAERLAAASSLSPATGFKKIVSPAAASGQYRAFIISVGDIEAFQPDQARASDPVALGAEEKNQAADRTVSAVSSAGSTFIYPGAGLRIPYFGVKLPVEHTEQATPVGAPHRAISVPCGHVTRAHIYTHESIPSAFGYEHHLVAASSVYTIFA